MSANTETRVRRLWALLLPAALLLAVVLAAVPVLSDSEAVVMIQPPMQEVLIAQSGQLALYVDHVEGLHSAELHLTYDPSVLDITDAHFGLPGTQVGPGDFFGANPWHFDINEVDEVAGTIDVLVALDDQHAGPGVSGSGALAVIDFQPIVPGTCAFVYVEAVLTDGAGVGIDNSLADGSVAVLLIRSSATPTPRYSVTATPTETCEPTPTSTSCCPTVIPATPTATATPRCRVFVWPPVEEVLVGHQSFADIMVENVHDVFAVEMHLSYDPAVITLVDYDPVTPGTQLEPGTLFSGLAWNEDLQTVDEALGTIDYVFSLDSSNPMGVSGAGSLARLNSVATQPGVSPIILVDVILAHTNGESLDCCENEDGRVDVVTIRSTSTPTPTVDPRASATPTSTPEGGDDPDWPDQVPDHATIYCEPSTRWLRPGETGWVDIYVKDAPGLYAAWVGLSYDPRLQIIDADLGEPGVQLEEGSLFAGLEWHTLANEVDTAAGSMLYAAKGSYPGPSLLTGGHLARIHVRGNELGVFPLDFGLTLLADDLGVSIPSVDEDGQVVVALVIPTPTPPDSPGGPTATPTVTPTPGDETPLPELYIEPDYRTLSAGEESWVEVRVREVTDLNACEFHLLYDPAVLTVLDDDAAAPGVQILIGSFLAADSVMVNEVDTAAGDVSFAIMQVPPSVPKSGEGQIARIRLQAVGQGTTPLAFFGSRLRDPAATAMAHLASGGVVAVNTQAVIGQVLLQGREDHSGVQIMHDGGEMALTAADGRFAFTCPLASGSPLTLTAQMAGYLAAEAMQVVPAGATMDYGTVELLGGDVVGPQMTVSRAAGCPGDATVTMPSESDGRVNVLDLTFVASRFGAGASDADWMPSADGCHPEWINYRSDINGDGQCDVMDIVLVGTNVGIDGPAGW